MRLPTLFRLFLLGISMARAAVPGLPPEVKNTQNPKDKPLAPAEALARFQLPAGFSATLFAGEPDVLQPIAMEFDDRGRLWVVECFSYPDFKVPNRDRVLIFTDRDGDGRFDERKVFLENGHRLSGLALGFGGVWLTSAPNLLFVPDANRDDVPDGPGQVLLDGFTLQAGHNMVNGLAWGPDGWLYGRHGITAPSLVGRPGVPETERLKFSCAIWRYHPIRKSFEVVAEGTTNPWGLDWDDFGQPFFSNSVIGHFWHLIPGAHYQRMFGEDFNPHVYRLLPQTADHLHWQAGDWTKSRTGQEERGGGHAHCGGMFYLGDNWPDEFRNRFLMGNIHGNRLLYDQIQRRGSGYVGRHGDNFLLARDPWFRAVQILGAPDGSVVVSDWNDLGECHDTDGAYRASGRIYRIHHGAAPSWPKDLDLQKQSDAQLVQLQLSRNDWLVRHARRLLQERAAAGRLSRDVVPELTRLVRTQTQVPRQLRALWALQAVGALHSRPGLTGDGKMPLNRGRTRVLEPQPAALLLELLNHPNEHLRWWAVQLLAEERSFSQDTLTRLALAAKAEASALVRLSHASILQRLPLSARMTLAAGLAARAEDANDPNLPLMIWYGIEPAVVGQQHQALQFAASTKIPLLREFIARRLASE